MRYPKKNIFLTSLACLMSLCLLPMVCWAALVVETAVVSGKIVQINTDHSVKLDNGIVYQPSRQTLNVDLAVGAPVTLRYMVEGEGGKVFFEYAPGLDSLSPLPRYAPSAEDKENN